MNPGEHDELHHLLTCVASPQVKTLMANADKTAAGPGRPLREAERAGPPAVGAAALLELEGAAALIRQSDETKRGERKNTRELRQSPAIARTDDILRTDDDHNATRLLQHFGQSGGCGSGARSGGSRRR